MGSYNQGDRGADSLMSTQWTAATIVRVAKERYEAVSEIINEMEADLEKLKAEHSKLKQIVDNAPEIEE